MSHIAKVALIVAAAGAGVLFLAKAVVVKKAPAPAPLRVVAPPSTPIVAQVAGDVQAAAQAGTAVAGFFSSLPSWSSAKADDVPALGAYDTGLLGAT